MARTASKTKRTIHCTHCGQAGHNRLKRPGLIASPDDDDWDDGLDGMIDKDELLNFDDAPCNEDLGLCPHGSTDDEGCEEPGCYGGSDC